MIRVNPLKKKKKSNHFCINGTSQVVSCFLLLSYSETTCVKLCNTRRSNELKICFWNWLARSMPMQGFCHYCGKLCQRLFQPSIHISKKVHLYSSVVAKNRIVDVIYQAWEAVFHHQMKCWVENMTCSGAFLTNFEVFPLVMKHCVECLILLLKQNDFRRRI